MARKYRRPRRTPLGPPAPPAGALAPLEGSPAAESPILRDAARTFPEHITTPMERFPRAKDQLTKIWLRREEQEQLAELDRAHLWLSGHGDNVMSEHRRESVLDDLVRAFRALEAQRLFGSQPQSKFGLRSLLDRDASREKFDPYLEHRPANKRAEDEGEFVLMRKSRMRELQRMEKELRAERGHLSQQALWMFDDAKVTTRLPQPYITAAVVEICDRELRAAKKEIRRLQAWRWVPWRERHVTDHPMRERDKRLHVFKRSLASPGSPSPAGSPHRPGQLTAFMHRRIRLQLLAETENEERELASMVREEALQRQTAKARTAAQRKQDYAIYVDMATRYGPLRDGEYEQLALPGAFYLSRTRRAALLIEGMWWEFWPGRKLRKRVGTTHVQRLWRGWATRRLYVPAIAFRRVRLHAIKRRNLRAWHEHMLKTLRVRAFVGSLLLSRQQKVFLGWKRWWAEIMRSRMVRFEKAAENQRVHVMERFWNRWITGVEQALRIRRMIRRAILRDCSVVFEAWADHVYAVVTKRMEQRGASDMQKAFRGFKGRRKAAVVRAEKKAVALSAQRVVRGFLARRRVLPRIKAIRDAIWAKHREKLDAAAQRRQAALVERESARLEAEETALREAEVEALARARKLFGSFRGGRVLSGEVKRRLKEAKARGLRIAKEQLRKGVMSEIEEELVARARAVVRYDQEHQLLNTTHIRCVVPECNCVFLRPEEYEAHECPELEQPLPGAPHLHLLLRDPRHAAALKKYIAVTHGVAYHMQLLHFWLAVEHLKTFRPYSTHYRNAAIEVFQRFCDTETNTAIRPTTFTLAYLEPLARTPRPSEASVRRKQRVLLQLLQDEHELPPTLFFATQWRVFKELLEHTYPLFIAHPLGVAHTQLVADERTAEMRRAEREFWEAYDAEQARVAREWQVAENHATAKVRQEEARRWLVNRSWAARRLMNKRLDAWNWLHWCARREFDRRDLLDMGRKALPHFKRQSDACEFLKVVGRQAVKSNLELYHAARAGALQTMRALLPQVVKQYEINLVNDYAARMQGLWRMKKARRLLVGVIYQTYTKIYDDDLEEHFYLDNRTGETSWDPPPFVGEDMLTPRAYERQCKREAIERARRRCENLTPDGAARKLQGMWRSKRALDQLRAIIRSLFIKRWAPQSQSYYYYNTQTQESQWTKPLLLGSAELECKIVCVECDVRVADVHCVDCEDPYCDDCYDVVHARGLKARHNPIEITPETVKCVECEAQVALINCAGCDDVYCTDCFNARHARGGRAGHRHQRIFTDEYLISVGLGGPRCEECEVDWATRVCSGCDQKYCDACFTRRHAKGARRAHEWKPLARKRRQIRSLAKRQKERAERQAREEAERKAKEEEEARIAAEEEAKRVAIQKEQRMARLLAMKL